MMMTRGIMRQCSMSTSTMGSVKHHTLQREESGGKRKGGRRGSQDGWATLVESDGSSNVAR
jgi:hypothetical protein